MKTIKITPLHWEHKKDITEWFELRNRVVMEKEGSLYINTSRYELKKFMEWANARHVGLAKDWVEMGMKRNE